jgi:RimJ/RimL family protein N-acetyltransferase
MRIEPATVTLKSGERVEVRSPEPEEGAVLLEYIRQLTREAPRALNHPPSYWDAFSVADESAFLRSMAEHPHGFLATAWHEGAPIGSAGVHPSHVTFSHHTGEIGMGVLAAWHGRGLARALMEILHREAVRNGVWNLHLRVRTFNAPAIALYEKMGWEKVGTLKEVAAFDDGSLADELLYQWRGKRTS